MQQNIYGVWKTIYYKGGGDLPFVLPPPLMYCIVLVLMVYRKQLGHCCVSVHMITMVTVQQGVAGVRSITHVQCRFLISVQRFSTKFQPH